MHHIAENQQYGVLLFYKAYSIIKQTAFTIIKLHLNITA